MPSPKQRITTVQVVGMSCNACVERVQQRLTSLTGVLSAQVDLTAQSAQVTYYPYQTSPGEWITPLAQEGYTLIRNP